MWQLIKSFTKIEIEDNLYSRPLLPYWRRRRYCTVTLWDANVNWCCEFFIKLCFSRWLQTALAIITPGSFPTAGVKTKLVGNLRQATSPHFRILARHWLASTTLARHPDCGIYGTDEPLDDWVPPYILSKILAYTWSGREGLVHFQFINMFKDVFFAYKWCTWPVLYTSSVDVIYVRTVLHFFSCKCREEMIIQNITYSLPLRCLEILV